MYVGLSLFVLTAEAEVALGFFLLYLNHLKCFSLNIRAGGESRL